MELYNMMVPFISSTCWVERYQIMWNLYSRIGVPEVYKDILSKKKLTWKAKKKKKRYLVYRGPSAPHAQLAYVGTE